MKFDNIEQELEVLDYIAHEMIAAVRMVKELTGRDPDEIAGTISKADDLRLFLIEELVETAQQFTKDELETLGIFLTEKGVE